MDDYISPNFELQKQQANRQKEMAKMLLQQGQAQISGPTGQMVSGRYVAQSPWQALQGPVNMLLGAYMAKKGDEESAKYAEALRQQGVKDVSDIMDLAGGRKELPSQELAGPAYNGVAPSIQYPEIKADPRAALARALVSQSPQAQALAPSLMQTVLPKQTENMIEYDKYRSEGGKLGFNEWKNQLTPYQKAHLGILASNQAQSRVPMGYRMKQDGTLEAIPGGPADIKAQTANAGRETVDALVTGLKEKYDVLKGSGGITSTADSGISNVPAWLASSAAGQTVGKVFGTENQSERNKIQASRTLLLQAIKNATGMSSKQMDSNVELQQYLKAATDPSLDYESNIAALQQLQDLYGVGGAATSNPTKMNRTVTRTGRVTSGPNAGKTATEYSDGTIEYR